MSTSKLPSTAEITTNRVAMQNLGARPVMMSVA
jgi:hypothetical protein